jgi:hypothetical protein
MTKHALKIQTLNASLRLMHYMEHNQAFPSHEDLLPHLQAEREQHRVDLEALAALAPEEEVALGWRYYLQKANNSNAVSYQDHS